MNASTRKQRGFTLLEVVLVLAILAALAGLSIVALVPRGKSAEIKIAGMLIQQVGHQLEAYRVDIGHYPTPEEGGLQALVTRPDTFEDQVAEKWVGYLKKLPIDPWGYALNYELDETDTEGPAYRLWSNGPDGQSDTDDDIRSWSDESEGV
jgi:general secretion pathway protein G